MLPTTQGPPSFKLRYKTYVDKLHNKHIASLMHILSRRRQTILSVGLLGIGSGFPESRWECHHSHGRGRQDLLDLGGRGQSHLLHTDAYKGIILPLTFRNYLHRKKLTR
jgi:hypothetical protein